MSAMTIPALFDGRSVRAVDVAGEPWFVATDAARELGYSHTPHMLRLLDDDEKGVHETDTPGGRQNLSIVSEPGLYKLIARSNKPEAKLFDRWVRHELVPSVRKTGRYGTALPDFSNPATLKALLLQSLDSTIELQGQVAALAPTADALDRLADTDGMILISDAAKQLQMQIKELFAWLRTNGWIFRRGKSKRDIGHADKIAAGYLVHKYRSVFQGSTPVLKEQVYLTPKGVARLGVLFGREVSS